MTQTQQKHQKNTVLVCVNLEAEKRSWQTISLCALRWYENYVFVPHVLRLTYSYVCVCAKALTANSRG